MIATAKNPTDRINSLKAQIGDLLDEAEGIARQAQAHGRELTAEESARFAAIMDEDTGELEPLRTKLADAEKQLANRKRLALMSSSRPADYADRPDRETMARVVKAQSELSRRPVFRDMQSGREVRALLPEDSLTARHLPQIMEAGDQPGLGERVVAHLTGRQIPGFSNSLLTGDDGAGGYVVDSTLFSPAFDRARSASVAFRAGALTLPMESSQAELLQLIEDPSVAWVAELGQIPAATLAFGRLRLEPRKLAAIVPVSTEMLEDASNAAEIIDRALSEAMGLALDRAILSGSGVGAEPRGVRNDPGVNTVTATDVPDDYSKVEEAVEKVYAANYPGEAAGLSWIANPRDVSRFNRLAASDGQPLRPTPGAAALQQFQTTSLPIDLNSGSDSEMIVGDMSQVLVGVRTAATIQFRNSGRVIDSAGDTIDAVGNDAILIVARLRADVAVMRPSWLTVVKDLGWD